MIVLITKTSKTLIKFKILVVLLVHKYLITAGMTNKNKTAIEIYKKRIPGFKYNRMYAVTIPADPAQKNLRLISF
jgi:hypothetical protein